MTVADYRWVGLSIKASHGEFPAPLMDSHMANQMVTENMLNTMTASVRFAGLGNADGGGLAATRLNWSGETI